MSTVDFLFEHPQDAERLAAEFLRAGIRGPRRAVDLLIEDLREHDDQRLLQLLDGAIGNYGPVEALLIDGHASLETLLDMKRRCKEISRGADNVTTHLQSMAGYFAVAAAALFHHGCSIISRDNEQLIPILLDLSAEVPDHWADLFIQASIHEES